MTQLVEILIHLYKNMETFQITKQTHFAGSIQKFEKIGEQFWWVNHMVLVFENVNIKHVGVNESNLLEVIGKMIKMILSDAGVT